MVYYMPTSPSGAAFNNKNSYTMKLAEYIKETRGEMKHVNWPTKSQAVNYTLLVVVLSIVTAAILALADFVFSMGIEKVILN